MCIRVFHKTLKFDAIIGDKILTAYGLYKANKKRIMSKDSNLCPIRAILVNTKEFQKNTKENMPTNTFCSHSSQEGLINSISSPDWYICNINSLQIAGASAPEELLESWRFW